MKTEIQLLREALLFYRHQPITSSISVLHEAHRLADAALTQPAQPAESALAKYHRLGVEADEKSPVERLRAFCSFAMNGQDWLDVDPFFDALRAQPAESVEAVYQCQGADGRWTDQSRDSYDYNVKHGGGPARVLYTAPPASQEQAPAYTYASTQATMCASCLEHKHTPLRIDAMGGYVCLTCIDRKLGSLLGEFGYPDPDEASQEQAQPHDMAGMLERGAKAWAGVDPQELRAGGQEQAQQPSGGEVGEREAFIAWLETTWPKCYPKGCGADLWRNGHLSALAWQARAAQTATPKPEPTA